MNLYNINEENNNGDNLLEAYLPFIGLIIFGNIENRLFQKLC